MFGQLQMIIAGAVAIAVGMLYWMYSAQVAENEKLTIQYNVAVERHAVDAAKIDKLAQTNRDNLKAYEDARNQNLRNHERINDLNVELGKQKEQKNELAKKLSGHNFTKLVIAKKGLMQRRMRDATRRVFNDFEAATARKDRSVQGPGG